MIDSAHVRRRLGWLVLSVQVVLLFAVAVAVPVAGILAIPFGIGSLVYLVKGEFAVAAEGFFYLAMTLGVISLCGLILRVVGGLGVRAVKPARPRSIAMWDDDLDRPIWL